MSEKRFSATLSQEEIDIMPYVVSENDGEVFYKLDGVVDLLNEQQATIEQLQDLCGKSDYENAKLRIENKSLQSEIKLLKPTNIEQYEQIQKLQEENEQLRKQVAEYEMILRQHEFAEKEGFQ